MPPTVSVILNCYNHELYVAEAIESVLGQTFKDFELILIDNGSTDGSRAVLERYDDPRIRRFFHDENQSLSKRLNEGVAAAKGEFVAVLFSDDMMLPDKLEPQVALFGSLPADYGVVYCPAIRFNQYTGTSWATPSIAASGDILEAMFQRHFDGAIDMASPLTRRECFLENGWFDDLFSDGEAVFFRIAIDWKFHFDAKPSVKLRDHDFNLGKAVRSNHDMYLTILARLLKIDRVDGAARSAINRQLARACVVHAWSYVRLDGSDTRWVRRQLSTAIRSNPSAALSPRWAGSFLLSLMPRVLRQHMNRAGNLFRERLGQHALVEGP